VYCLERPDEKNSWFYSQQPFVDVVVVLLLGFQKGREIKASQGKGQGAVLAKKGQFVSYKEKLEKRTEFHSFSHKS
jgi:hypothetical protein